MATVEPTENNKAENELSISQSIDIFLHRILDIEDCAQEYITVARKNYNNNSENLKNKISENQKLISDSDPSIRLIGARNIRKLVREIDRHNNSSRPETLEKSLFINLFASFDKYVGELITVLYQKKPCLYKNINREIPLSEVLKYESMDELRQVMLDKEIESLRRKSYIEQFKELETKFSISLTKFKEWPNFIEIAQRRNLFTHCDGVISKQYLDICEDVGYKNKEKKVIGEQLDIGSKYFFQSCTLMSQVAVMLGHTLWRKIVPKEQEKADGHLSNLVFDFLHMEHWRNALSLSQFALDLPSISSDQSERIFHINYAIALSSIKKTDVARETLNKKDWSATSYDFKLAFSILTDDYLAAKELMIKIGKEGELVNELSYHDWPLFKNFRESEEFTSAYEIIFGYKYLTKLNELAEEKKSAVIDIPID